MSPASGDTSGNATSAQPPKQFPIKWCHQRVVTVIRKVWDPATMAFPIKWCHQRVVTLHDGYAAVVLDASFQSSGVTSEW